MTKNGFIEWYITENRIIWICYTGRVCVDAWRNGSNARLYAHSVRVRGPDWKFNEKHRYCKNRQIFETPSLDHFNGSSDPSWFLKHLTEQWLSMVIQRSLVVNFSLHVFRARRWGGTIISPVGRLTRGQGWKPNSKHVSLATTKEERLRLHSWPYDNVQTNH